MATVAELEAQLAEVQSAITALLGSAGLNGVQTYTIAVPGGGSQTVTRASLADLRALRADLTAELNHARGAAATGGLRNLGTRGHP